MPTLPCERLRRVFAALGLQFLIELVITVGDHEGFRPEFRPIWLGPNDRLESLIHLVSRGASFGIEKDHPAGEPTPLIRGQKALHPPAEVGFVRIVLDDNDADTRLGRGGGSARHLRSIAAGTTP